MSAYAEQVVGLRSTCHYSGNTWEAACPLDSYCIHHTPILAHWHQCAALPLAALLIIGAQDGL